MAKKKVQSSTEEIEVIAPETESASEKAEVVEVESTQTVSANKKTKKASKKETKEEVIAKENAKSNSKDKSKDKSKAKSQKDKKSLKKKTAEVWSELKKVSRPSFGKVVKNTCVVISVVAICTLLLFGMDKLFSLLYNLLLS